MAIARVVSFDGVSSARIAEMKDELEGSGRPDEIPASEIVVLHDPGTERSVVVVFFENEDDYAKGDAALSAMPADETPGRRVSVDRFDVAFRMTV